MKTSTKIILCVGLILYGFFLFAAMTFYRLPADEILNGALDKMTHGKITLSAEKSSSSLWKGHYLEDLTWTIDSHGSLVVERMKSLTLSPNFLRLFQGYAAINMKGELAKGRFIGNAGFSLLRGLKKTCAVLEASGIELENLAFLRPVAQRDITGKLKGRVEVNGDLNDFRKINGQGTITVENGALGIKAGGFGFKTIPFAKVFFPFKVKSGLTDLKGSKISGPLFEGDIEGQIKIQNDFRTSPIEMQARIVPASSSHGGQAGKSPTRGGPIVIELHGTIGNPLISWTGVFP